jgi:hypothetical protein
MSGQHRFLDEVPVDKYRAAPLLFVGLLLAFTQLRAQAGTINFEDLPDSTIVTTQYPGVSFTNAIVLSAGISLNEFEFPPHSGTNVISDNGGPMTLSFSTPVTSFSGYFTYLTPLTVMAFDGSSTHVGNAASLFNSNLALSGDPGSSPNELLQVVYAAGISSVTIIGDPAGGSFVLDDASFQAATSTAPEPTSVFQILIGVTALALLKRRSAS